MTSVIIIHHVAFAVWFHFDLDGLNSAEREYMGCYQVGDSYILFPTKPDDDDDKNYLKGLRTDLEWGQYALGSFALNLLLVLCYTGCFTSSGNPDGEVAKAMALVQVVVSLAYTTFLGTCFYNSFSIGAFKCR